MRIPRIYITDMIMLHNGESFSLGKQESTLKDWLLDVHAGSFSAGHATPSGLRPPPPNRDDLGEAGWGC
jgi:hypothetical protein